MSQIKQKAFLLGLVFSLIGSSTEAGMWDSIKGVFTSKPKSKAPTIRVLLSHQIGSADLDVRGSCIVLDPFREKNGNKKKRRLATHFGAKRRLVRANPSSTFLEWGEEYVDCHQIEIIPDRPETPIVINGTEYRGKLYVYEIKNKISIVNEVNLEEYLASTLAPFNEKQLPDEAIAALSIAARTSAYVQSIDGANPYWHVRAEDVGYTGHKVHAPNTPVGAALSSSKNMVVSKTGPWEGTISPIMIEVTDHISTSVMGRRGAHFSPDEARDLAQKGNNAAQILAKTFPETSIQLLNHPGSAHQHQITERSMQKQAPMTHPTLR